MPHLLHSLLKPIPRKKIAAITASLVLAGASLGVVPLASAASCDDNYIVRCGVSSPSALVQAYQSDSYVQKVYSYFGISSSDINNLAQHSTNGYVTKTGDVVVNGKTVATGAITAGRDFISGSTKVNYQGITFYKRPPSVSFRDNQLSAYIAMDSNNQFAFAVLPSCGNPITATPVPSPKPKPAPTAKCTSLSLDKLDTLKYRATATYTMQNATFKSASFNFGDQTQAEQGQNNANNNSATAVHTYQSPGNYTVKATLTFSSTSGDNQDTSVTCSIPISPTKPTPPPTPSSAPTPTPPPATPISQQTLPNTGGGGIATMAGLFTGSTALGTVAYRFRLGRKLHK